MARSAWDKTRHKGALLIGLYKKAINDQTAADFQLTSWVEDGEDAPEMESHPLSPPLSPFSFSP